MNEFDDVIAIEGLKIFGHHGVFDFEKQDGQFFYVDAVIHTDTQAAAATDNIGDAVNYAEVCEYIEKYVTGKTVDLIETLAEELAAGILWKFGGIRKIEITVHKPSAPVEQQVRDISVSVQRCRHIAFVAYGSNMGDSKKIIDEAVAGLTDNKYINIIAKSSDYRSAPYGGVEQDDFINGIIMLETVLSPHNLLEVLHKYENEAGRQRTVHWGPRTLDLDIIFYDKEIIKSEELTVPHSDMHNRDFVLVPLCEIAPDFIHPVYNKSVRELKENLTGKYIR